jgi:hypothetical protein
MKYLPPIMQLAATALLSCALQAGVYRTIYVSPNGGGDGSSPGQPATIDGAKTYIRNYSAFQTGDIEVILAEGIYFFPAGAPLTLTDADSGKNGYRIVWRNEPGKTVRWSAGYKVQTAWTPAGPGSSVYYSSWIPSWNFRQMYVDGRAEHLTKSQLFLNDAFVNWNTSIEADKYIEISKANLPTWPAWHPTEIKLFARWTTQTARIVSKEEIGEKVRLRVSNPSIFKRDGKYTENASDRFSYQFQRSSFFTNGGFYQRISEPVWYKVPAGVNMATAEVIVPQNDQVLIVRGATDVNRASNILFHGISFEHSNFANPSTDDGFAGFQAARYRKIDETAVSLPGAVQLSNTENVDFENCTFRNLGATGLSINQNVRGTRVLGNTFYEIAASAIALSPHDNSVNVEGCVVSDNRISRCGTAYEEACGIWMRWGKFHTILNNELSDLPYTGISIGWGWGHKSHPSDRLQGNWCNYNNIHHVMNTLRDGAAIYTLHDHASDAHDEGTRIFENFTHSITLNPAYGPGHFAYGLYFDQGSKHILAEHNKVENVSLDKFIYVQTIDPPAEIELVANNNAVASVSAFAGPRPLGTSYQAERNIAPFARTYSSTKFSYSHHADKASDLRSNTLWASATGDSSPWYLLDFMRPQRVTRIEIQARQEINQAVARENFKIYGCSGAGGTGTKTLLHTQISPFAHQGTLVVPVPAAQTFQSVSVEKIGSGHFNFAEVRIFSDN